MQITIRNYLQEMTEVLRKKKIIELSLYNEVNDPQIRELPDTKQGGPQNSRKRL